MFPPRLENAQNDNVTGCALGGSPRKIADHVGFNGLMKVKTSPAADV